MTLNELLKRCPEFGDLPLAVVADLRYSDRDVTPVEWENIDDVFCEYEGFLLIDID